MAYQRPATIIDILDKLNSDEQMPLREELVAYITTLESRQPERPQQIDDILEVLAEAYAPTMRASLALYLTELETSQVPATRQQLDDETIPLMAVWSHERQQQRAQQRKSRALRKQNGYSK